MGIITEVSYQRRDRSRVNVYVDGEFFGGMAAVVAAEHRLKPGVEVDAETLKELMQKSNAEQAMKKSINLISRLPKTEKELCDYLKKKGFSDEIIDGTLQKIKDYGYINDQDYACAYASSHSQSKGRQKISYDLKLKGIKDEYIQEALKVCSDEEQTARTVAQKYIKSKPLDQKTQRNLAHHLYSRGFDWETIKKILREIFRSAGNEYD